MEDLRLADTSVSGQLRSLTNLSTSLQFLRLRNTAIGGDLDELSDFVALRYLDLTNTTVSGPLTALADMGQLSSVLMASTRVSGDIGSLHQMASLEAVVLSGNRAVSGDLKHLARRDGLTKLQLENTDCFGDLSSLSLLRKMTVLNLRGSNVTGDLSALANLSAIRELTLSATSVEGDLISLVPLGRLRKVHLSATSVHGRLMMMQQLRNLRYLDLEETAVEGDSVPRSSALRSLQLRNTSVSIQANGIERGKLSPIQQECYSCSGVKLTSAPFIEKLIVDPGFLPLDWDGCRCNAGCFDKGQAGRFSDCRLCPVGKFSASNGSEVCEECPPGSHAAREGSSRCQDCSGQQVSEKPGESECRPCSFGKIPKSKSECIFNKEIGRAANIMKNGCLFLCPALLVYLIVSRFVNWRQRLTLDRMLRAAESDIEEASLADAVSIVRLRRSMESMAHCSPSEYLGIDSYQKIVLSGPRRRPGKREQMRLAFKSLCERVVNKTRSVQTEATRDVEMTTPSTKYSDESNPKQLEGRAGNQLDFPGRNVRFQKFSTVSFPGSYAKEWTEMTQGEDHLPAPFRRAVACVFFPDEHSDWFGVHTFPCKCVFLYKGVHPDFPKWDQGQAPWGCMWCEQWLTNIKGVKGLGQVPLVVYKAGKCGNNVDGLGYSQRGEVKLLDDLGLVYACMDIEEYKLKAPVLARTVASPTEDSDTDITADWLRYLADERIRNLADIYFQAKEYEMHGLTERAVKCAQTRLRVLLKKRKFLHVYVLCQTSQQLNWEELNQRINDWAEAANR